MADGEEIHITSGVAPTVAIQETLIKSVGYKKNTWKEEGEVLGKKTDSVWVEGR